MLAAVSGIGGPAPGLAPVIVTDRARPAAPSTTMLSGVFGLSPGKADVASSLAGGRSAEEVARLLVLASKMDENDVLDTVAPPWTDGGLQFAPPLR